MSRFSAALAGRRLMGRLAACLLLALALLAPASRAAAAPVRLSIACGALGVELELCSQAVAEWERATGNEVTIVTTPNSSTDRLALYLQMLASGADDLDVLQIDVVWAGVLASHLADLRPFAGDAPVAHFPALIENDTVDGRLVAMPWWADVGVLYYRKDLLAKYGFAPPGDWQEMTTIARTIQKAERVQGSSKIRIIRVKYIYVQARIFRRVPEIDWPLRRNRTARARRDHQSWP